MDRNKNMLKYLKPSDKGSGAMVEVKIIADGNILFQLTPQKYVKDSNNKTVPAKDSNGNAQFDYKDQSIYFNLKSHELVGFVKCIEDAKQQFLFHQIAGEKANWFHNTGKVKKSINLEPKINGGKLTFSLSVFDHISKKSVQIYLNFSEAENLSKGIESYYSSVFSRELYTSFVKFPDGKEVSYLMPKMAFGDCIGSEESQRQIQYVRYNQYEGTFHYNVGEIINFKNGGQ